MSDQPTSPDHELASAYVDDLASAPQRAQVEASPELMALVRSFREQRVSLAAVPPVSPVVRDLAVAAALAEFDAVQVGPPVAPPANVVPLDRQRRWNRVLGAAAAIAVVGLVGVAVANIGSSSNDSASMSTGFTESAGTRSASDPSKVGVAGADTSNLSPSISGAPSPVLDTATGANATETTAGNPGTIGSIDGGGSAVPELSDTAALKALPEPAAKVSPSFVFSCSLSSRQEVVLEITWRGTPAVVVRDTVSGVIAVIDAQCNTLVTVAN